MKEREGSHQNVSMQIFFISILASVFVAMSTPMTVSVPMPCPYLWLCPRSCPRPCPFLCLSLSPCSHSRLFSRSCTLLSLPLCFSSYVSLPPSLLYRSVSPPLLLHIVHPPLSWSSIFSALSLLCPFSPSIVNLLTLPSVSSLPSLFRCPFTVSSLFSVALPLSLFCLSPLLLPHTSPSFPPSLSLSL